MARKGGSGSFREREIEREIERGGWRERWSCVWAKEGLYPPTLILAKNN